MSLRLVRQRSIASQLVVLFTLAAAFLLSCGLGVFYWIVVQHAFAEDNAVLADKILAIRHEIKAPEGPRALEDQLNMLRPGEHAVFWVRVSDVAGRVMAESSGMEESLPSRVFPPVSTETLSPKDFRKDGQLFSLVTTSETVAGQPVTIQVAQDRSGDDEFTKGFGVLLAIVLVLGILAAAIIATTVTRRGLRPVAEMTESLKRIGPTQLHERLGVMGWPTELQPMAVAFDGMLNRLEDSFTRLSQFSADLAHELRTPVANIRGEAEVSLTRDRTSSEYREVIESCVAECARLSDIIENLLFLAQADSADRQIHSTLFDGRAGVEKIAAYYQTGAEERQIQITCEGGGEIQADPLLFGRAVSNLVDNALRFTPDGGKIVIRVGFATDSAAVAVEDNGAGIPAKSIARVFDRFYRVDSSRSMGGTGLGLALVRSIVELHGGSATVTSEEGRGTSVTLIFPYQPKS
jgi:two-component system, OmpR family, heavy metal sensor histidine kinase CusS